MDARTKSKLLIWIKNYRRELLARTVKTVEELDKLEGMLRE